MSRKAAFVLLVLFLAVFFLQCSSGQSKSVPRDPVRTVQDVDRDLQTFKTVIRTEMRSRDNLFLVIGGASLALNLILFGFVFYFWKQSRRPAAVQKKKPVRKKPAAPKKTAIKEDNPDT